MEYPDRLTIVMAVNHPNQGKSMAKEIKPEFVVSKHDGKCWIEIFDGTGVCISRGGLMGFSLHESSSEKEAQKVADFMNNNIDKILFTPF